MIYVNAHTIAALQSQKTRYFEEELSFFRNLFNFLKKRQTNISEFETENLVHLYCETSTQMVLFHHSSRSTISFEDIKYFCIIHNNLSFEYCYYKDIQQDYVRKGYDKALALIGKNKTEIEIPESITGEVILSRLKQNVYFLEKGKH